MAFIDLFKLLLVTSLLASGFSEIQPTDRWCSDHPEMCHIYQKLHAMENSGPGNNQNKIGPVNKNFDEIDRTGFDRFDNDIKTWNGRTRIHKPPAIDF